MNIGEAMYRRRKELGLSLEEVGDRIGVGKSTVSKWENGMMMGADKLVIIAKALEMEVMDLLK